MSTLYIRLPSRAVAGDDPNWGAYACPFALVAQGNTITRQGIERLPDLAATVAASQRVVLLLAAGDATLLRLKVPPLSAARQKAILVNLAEEQLLADPEACIAVAGGVYDGLHTVAIAQRAWLETLARTLVNLGARNIAAFPAQSCLGEGQPDGASAAILEWDDAQRHIGTDLTIRLAQHEGFGLAVGSEQRQPGADSAIHALCALVATDPITLFVPQPQMHSYQKAINQSGAANQRITLSADNWSRWLAGLQHNAPDLMSGLGTAHKARLDWRPWRWPAALAALVLLVNTLALNIDWWRMKNESRVLRASMVQIYKSAYPQETVILDPLAQIKQKIAIARHDAGQAAPDDFTSISAAFGAAWSSVVTAPGNTTAIASLAYHDHSLLARLKPGRNVPMQSMREALAKYQLTLELAPGQSGATVWQIRSIR